MEDLQSQQAIVSDEAANLSKELMLFSSINSARHYRILRELAIGETPERREPGWVASEVVRNLLGRFARLEPVVREVQNFLRQPEAPTLAEIAAADSPLMRALERLVDPLLVARVSDLLHKDEDVASEFLVILQLDLTILPPELLEDFGHLRLEELREQIDTVPMALKLLARAPVYERRLAGLVPLGHGCRNRLVADYQPLVLSIARRRCWQLKLRPDNAISQDDLCQAGVVGLLQAIDKFNARLGFRFAAYARRAIENEINDLIRRSLYAVKIPKEVVAERSRISHIESELRRDLGKDDVDHELCEALGISWDKLQSVKDDFQPALSLDVTIGDDETGLTLADKLVDSSVNVEESACSGLMCEKVHKALQTLPERDRQLLELRFGLTGYREHTFDELGKKLGISRQAVHKTVGRALEKLRHPGLGLVDSDALA